MSSSDSPVDNCLPNFFSLLTEEDKSLYHELKTKITANDYKYKRNKRLSSLQSALNEIQQYCERPSGKIWARYLVCGICWMGIDIAINTRQLRNLLGKSKSSINGALAKIGYVTVPQKSDMSAAILEYIPYLKGNFVEQRQWSVRRMLNSTPSITPVQHDFPVFNPKPSMTPTPTLQNDINISETIFGIEQESPFETKVEFDPPDYNLFVDPCTCCPIQWINQDTEYQDIFGYG